MKIVVRRYIIESCFGTFLVMCGIRTDRICMSSLENAFLMYTYCEFFASIRVGWVRDQYYKQTYHLVKVIFA